MVLTSMQKGSIIESQIANLLMVVSDGELSPFMPIVDDAGVDLIVSAKGTFNTVFLQIKSRFVRNSRYKNRIDFQIKRNSLSESSQVQVLLVYYDQDQGDIETMWLIPSSELINNAVKLENYYRVSASRSSDSADKWSKYKVEPKDLVRVLNTQLTGRWS